MSFEETLQGIPNLVTDEDNEGLIRPISLDELEKMVFSMKDNKSLGPDGFHINVFKAYWETIKDDLLRCCKESRRLGKVLGSMNAMFIALIPKEKNPISFDRFTLVSLCNVCYKFISKLMVNRLKKILPRLISEEQGGFAQGKHIGDIMVLAREVLHSARIRKDLVMFIKLNMAKAYDILDRKFLLKVLEHFGFSQEWRNWTMLLDDDEWNPSKIL
eukprot:Gb_41626 [translate_table: standard]